MKRKTGAILPEMLLNLLHKAATEPYPTKPIGVSEGFRGKIAVEDEVCIGCSLCSVVCPTSCIEMVPDEKEVKRGERTIVRKRKPVVHLMTCIRCGLCEESCPTEPKAIHLTEEFSGTYTDKDVVVE
jgi:formate hydrogenlyase subunit 6/NADH:ubiquinone oxidoreductase subunit I